MHLVVVVERQLAPALLVRAALLRGEVVLAGGVLALAVVAGHCAGREAVLVGDSRRGGKGEYGRGGEGKGGDEGDDGETHG